jgi:hypothetical protein
MLKEEPTMYYQHKLKKLTSLLLSALLLMMLLPVTVRAMIGVTNEQELRDAVSNAVNGDIISIDSNITLTQEPAALTINKNITLTSSNGSTLNIGSQADSSITISLGSTVVMDGDLVVTGSGTRIIDVSGIFTLAGNARIEQTRNESSVYAIYNSDTGTVNISGGQITSSYTAIENRNKLTINSGTISGVTYGIRTMTGSGEADISAGAIQGGTALYLGSGAKADISGGTFTGTGASSIALGCSGTADITGGTFTGTVLTYAGGTIDLDATGGNVSIPGGIGFNQSGQTRKYINVIPAPVSIDEGDTATITLEGVFSGLYFSIDTETTPAVLGASISNNVVSLNPSAAGTHSLVLTAQDTTGAPQTLKLTLPVTVTGSAKVCAIGTVQYENLDEALAAVGTDETTIRLLTDITYSKGMVIDGKSVIFDLDGHTLNVINAGGIGLDVANGGHVSYTGTGSFNVSGTECGVKVIGDDSSAAVNNVTAAGDGSTGVFADSAGQVTVNGNINVTADEEGGNVIGAYAYGEYTNIAVNGGIFVEGDNSWGVFARYLSTIEVDAQTGDSITITGYYSKASEAYNATVTVDGSISASGYSVCGAVSSNLGLLTAGDITISGDGAKGLDVCDLGEVIVNGSINAAGDHSYGVYAYRGEGDGGTATVNGNVAVSGDNSKGIVIQNFGGKLSTVTVNGSVEAVSTGLDTRLGHVHITGDVKSYTYYGASVKESDVVIDGNIDAPSYLYINDIDMPDDSYSNIDEQGYSVYEGDDGSIVKVGNITNRLPVVITFTVTAADITDTSAHLRGSVTDEGSSPVTEYGFKYSDGYNHTIMGAGPADSFTANLTGLTPGTTYSVRAFAVSSAGTAYGQTVTFTTNAIDPPGMPINRRYLAHDGAMELFWEPGTDGGSPILYYEILRGGDLTAPWTNVGNVTSYMAAGLENGIYYTFSIRAVNAAGPGEAGVINGRPNIPTVPGPPRELYAHNSSQQVSVSWREPWSNGYRDITGYQVSSDGSNWVDADHSSAHTFTGLTNDAVYTFYVRAVNEIGAGEPAHIEGRPRSYGGGSYGPGIPTAPPAQTLVKADVLDSGGNVAKTVTATHDRNTGTVTAEVDSASLAGAFETSEADEDGVVSIEIVMPEIEEAEAYGITLPANAFSAANLTGTVEIRTGIATVTLPDNMLPEDLSSGAQKITLTVAAGDPGKLDEDVREQIGSRPVIELKLVIDGEQASWSNENAPVTVAIPYAPAEEELANPESIIIWYIDGNGNAICVPNGRYDPVTGTVVFTTTHFSYYTVGYNKTAFRDVLEDAWYYEAVSCIAARNIVPANDDAVFRPDTNLTRGDFLVMLMRTYEISPDTDPADNFSDAGDTYYTGYLAAAKKLGISAGVGNNMYAPEREITRQEMFTLLYKALKVINRLPKGNSRKTLADFADADQISSWARESMTLLVETGIIIGSNGRLTPGKKMTRAQMAQVLQRLLETGLKNSL